MVLSFVRKAVSINLGYSVLFLSFLQALSYCALSNDFACLFKVALNIVIYSLAFIVYLVFMSKEAGIKQFFSVAVVLQYLFELLGILPLVNGFFFTKLEEYFALMSAGLFILVLPMLGLLSYHYYHKKHKSRGIVIDAAAICIFVLITFASYMIFFYWRLIVVINFISAFIVGGIIIAPHIELLLNKGCKK